MSDTRDRKPDDPMAGIHWDLDKSISYSQYLQLDKVLDAQKPLSGQHDEMLFIVIHQASELWIKLCLHELVATRAQIRGDDLEPAFKMLSRVARIQTQLIQSWDVLRTMTPSDYTKFRDSLGQSSGFQSWQYRLLEFVLGNKEPRLSRSMRATNRRCAGSKRELATPYLYDERSGCWRGAASTSRRSARSATGRSPIRPIRRARPGSRCIADATGTGTSTSSPRSSSTSSTGCSSGASRT